MTANELPTAPPELSGTELLTTTHAVRRRLDLVRPVPREAVIECIEIAAQAPNAVNKQRLVWVVVDDPAVRAGMAEIFRSAQRALRVETPEGDNRKPAADGTQVQDSSTMNTMPEAMNASVSHLRENLHNVPVLVVPTIAGRHEDAPNPAALWGSILPAVWNFMLALRLRGMGSCWTTVHLSREKEMAELLGIPYDEVSQAGLFPVAYTIGTEFKRGTRDADQVFWNGWDKKASIGTDESYRL